MYKSQIIKSFFSVQFSQTFGICVYKYHILVFLHPRGEQGSQHLSKKKKKKLLNCLKNISVLGT